MQSYFIKTGHLPKRFSINRTTIKFYLDFKNGMMAVCAIFHAWRGTCSIVKSTTMRKYNFENSVIAIAVPSAKFQRWIPNLICVFVLVAVEEKKKQFHI